MRIFPERYVGNKYGDLTAVDYDHCEAYETDTRTRYTHYFRFRCDCGNEIVTNIHNVLSGKTRTCGKCKKNKWIGRKIGRTTIKALATVNGKPRMVLKCECGYEYAVSQAVVSVNQHNPHYMCKKCRKNQKIIRENISFRDITMAG